MWELVKAFVYLLVLIPSVLLACIGLVCQWVIGLFDKAKDAKIAELEDRQAALEQAERQRNVLGPNPDTDVLEAHATELLLKAGFPDWNKFSDGIIQRYKAACSSQGRLSGT